MQEVYVLSHASDMDGVGGAALVSMKYGVPLSNIFFTEYTKEGIEYVNRKLSGKYKKGITLFLTDLGVDDALVKDYLKIVSGVKRNGGEVFWFDHHPWADRAVKKIATLCDKAIVGENRKYCGTEMTYGELGFTDRFTRRFKEMVHYSDFNLKPRTEFERGIIRAYTLSITSYSTSKSRDYRMRKLRHIVKVLRGKRFLDRSMKSDADRFERIDHDRTERMLAGMLVRRKFAVGFSNTIQSTAGCLAVMERAKTPIGMYVDIDDWKGHIRCETKDISTLARQMGGGGHPHAAGFVVNPGRFGHLRTKEHRELFAAFLEEKINRFVKW